MSSKTEQVVTLINEIMDEARSKAVAKYKDKESFDKDAALEIASRYATGKFIESVGDYLEECLELLQSPLEGTK